MPPVVPLAPSWHEVLEERGAARPEYETLLAQIESLPREDRRRLEHRLDTARRELGVPDWNCDLLPHVFGAEEWERLERGLDQRARAFDHFLRDIHGPREILHAGAVPLAAVLGSPYFQRGAAGVAPEHGHYLHLASLALRRNARGDWEVTSQHFGRAPGLARMVQNRRLLARVAPELFHGRAVAPIADAPIALLEALRAIQAETSQDRRIVLLGPGPASPHHADDSFLARRMGIPLVRGSDMVVLNDQLHLRTIGGLERVHVVLSTVAERYLDPLALDSDSSIGVAGLVHCLRRGSVALVNGLGAQLADDRSLLAHSSRIIRFYLNEQPIIPSTTTYWLGDPDQREMVLAEPGRYRLRPLHGEATRESIREEVRKQPHLFVAQPAHGWSETLTVAGGRRSTSTAEHVLFGLRRGERFDVFPGALTLLGTGRCKDAWVPPRASSSRTAGPAHPSGRAPHLVTAPTAESLYWLGRYLERTRNLAGLLQTVELLELEELNAYERRVCRPVWNGLLPPLDSGPRRGLGSIRERHRLALCPDEFGSLRRVFTRVWRNADDARDVLSPEVFAALAELQEAFARSEFDPKADEESAARLTRRIAESATRGIATFSGLAEATMPSDDAFRFCLIGRQIERAVLTANATLACPRAFTSAPTRETEIELSAFLRLLGTRDNYRRIYQTRAEPRLVLELLWQDVEAPRSIMRALSEAAVLLASIYPAEGPASAVRAFLERLRALDWRTHFHAAEASHVPDDEPMPESPDSAGLLTELRSLNRGVTALHDAVAAQLAHPQG